MHSLRRHFGTNLIVLALTIMPGAGLRAQVRDQLGLPVIKKESLLNGLEFLVLPAQSPRVSFVLMIRNGAAFDPVKKWGATDVLARMMMEKTQKHKASQLKEDLRKWDASLQTRVDWDAIYFYGSAPQANLVPVLELLSEIVIHPDLNEPTFKRVRAEALQELLSEKHKSESLTLKLFRRNLFGHSPYSHPVEGTPATLRQLQLVDVKILYKRLVLPNQAQLAVGYSGQPQDLVQSLSRAWGSWVREDAAPFSFRRAGELSAPRIVLVNRQTVQSIFRWGNLSVTMSSADYFPLKVLEEYLTLQLPEWAQDVASEGQIQAQVQLQALRMRGFFQISVQAPQSHLLDYYRKLREALDAIRQGKIDPGRFSEARRLAYVEFKERFEKPESQLFELLKAYLYEVGISSIATYRLRMERVTPGQLTEVMDKYLPPDRFLLVVAGPVTELKPRLAKLGKVEVVPYESLEVGAY